MFKMMAPGAQSPSNFLMQGLNPDFESNASSKYMQSSIFSNQTAEECHGTNCSMQSMNRWSFVAFARNHLFLS